MADTEDFNVEEDRGVDSEVGAEGVAKEANPDLVSAQTFADDVVSKVALVESGEMTLAEFVEGCTATLQEIQTPEVGDLGGLGTDAGEFPDLEDEGAETV